MTSRTRKVSITLLTVAGLVLGGAGTAGATTFCVPGFHAGCPANGSNVAQPDLETAMKTNGSDGVPDRVFVDAITYTNPASIDPAGTDDLEVIGAGPAKTRLTSSSTGAGWVVDLNLAPRDVTMRDLRIVVPALGGNTSAVHSNGDTFQNVDIEAQEADARGISPAEGGTTFRDGALLTTGAGTYTYGFWSDSGAAAEGELLIERSVIANALRSVSVDRAETPLTMRRVAILNPGETAVSASASNDVAIDNSVIETGSSSPIYLYSTTPSAQDVALTNVTVDSSSGDSTVPAITGTVQATIGNGSIDIEIDSSIIRGFDKAWQLQSPAGNASIGDIFVAAEYSNLVPNGTNTGNGTTFLAPTNSQSDPRFSGFGDYRLRPDSPAIDAGNPSATGLAPDFFGVARPVDGNEDGTAIRDQGAYEYRPPVKPRPACEVNPALCQPPPPQDTTAPKVNRVLFRAPTRTRSGYLKFTLSEPATVRATLKPTPAGKGRNKRKTLKLTANGRAGVNRVKIKKGKMKLGRYRLTISATDAAGNRSGTLAGKVRVKPLR